MSGRSGKTFERARLRQQRWNKIERLKMIDVLTLLPLLMHSALLLFAVGLCVYLWDINIVVAMPVTATTCIFTFVYAATMIHSLTVENCPYTTASSKLVKLYIEAWLASPTSLLGTHVKHSVAWLRSWATKVVRHITVSLSAAGAKLIPPWIQDYSVRLRPWTTKLMADVSSQLSGILSTLLTTFFSSRSDADRPSTNVEPSIVQDRGMDITTSRMLSWLLINCHDSETIDLVVRSLAGADPWLPRLPLLESGALSTAFQWFDRCFEYNVRSHLFHLRSNISSDEASLCLRSVQFLLGYYNGRGFVLYIDQREAVMKNTWSQDFYPRHFSEIAFRIENEK
ncbi:hypothetical protein FRC07_003084 [Ceratobasidium sp. 392]|nr:hypothetical protein FRC07_003084 [Ceratobasidium sp. 392]